jgi:hypothetical protein
MKKTVLIVYLAVSLNIYAQQGNLIAHYPLTSTPNDTTGHLGPMTLTHAPFLGGGIYCNGFYIGEWPQTGCNAETPVLPASIFRSFSVSAKFKVDSVSGTKPVLVGGMGYRWIGCLIRQDSTIEFMYNNVAQQQPGTLHISMKTWHEITITYDSINTIAKLYLDGILEHSANFTIIHGSDYDRTFGVINPGNGSAFKGFLRDVKIYSNIIIPNVGVEDLAGNASIRLYPNPNNGKFRIDIFNAAKNRIRVEIYNLTGSRILDLTDSNQDISKEINLSKFSKGIYLTKIYDGMTIYSEKIVIQ